jgi:hypothetical protein
MVRPPALVHAIQDATARLRLIGVAEELGYACIELPRGAERFPTSTAAVVHDLLPFGDALSRLRTWRSALPTVPIILYAPAMPGVEPRLIEAAQLPGVYGLLQFDRPGEAARLADHVRHWIGSAPELRVRRVLDALFPDLPAEVRRFLFTTLQRLATPGAGASVREVAAELGVSARTLERRFPRALPGPKKWAGLMTLFHVGISAEWGREEIPAAARRLGVRTVTLGRTWRRLVTAEPPMTEPALFVTSVVVSLARRCALPRERVDQALEQPVA